MYVLSLALYFSTSLLAVGLVTVLLTIRRRSKVAGMLSSVLFLYLIWAVLAFFEQSFVSPGLKRTMAHLQYIPTAILPYYWLKFGLASKAESTEKPWHPAFKYLWIPILVMVIIVWQTHTNGLEQQNFILSTENKFLLVDGGFWFWVHALYSFAFLLGGIILVLQSIRPEHYRRRQLALLTFSLVAPLVLNMFYLSGVFPPAFSDPTPASLLLAVGVIMLNHHSITFRYNLYHAYDIAIEGIQNAIIVVTNKQRLIFANDYASRLFKIEKSMIGNRLSKLETILSELDLSSIAGCTRSHLYDPKTQRHYELQCSSVRTDMRNWGLIVTFYNVTKQIHEIDEPNSNMLERLVQQRITDLSKANEELRLELERRERIEAQLIHDAIHDPLTGLGNRSLLFDTLQRVAAGYQRDSQNNYCILYLDFNGFKDINDNYGHDVGDLFLIEVAKRLRTVMRDSDSVCRFGGDEFVVLLTDIDGVKTAKKAIPRIITAVTQPLVLNQQNITPSLSIGAAFASDEDGRFENVLKNADMAMYEAKLKGKDQWAIFDEEMKREVFQKRQLFSELATAIQQHIIYPVFQPIINSRGRAVGWEALARWTHTTLGQIEPSQFIQEAEDSHLIAPLGELMITKTLETAAELQAAGLEENLYFSINVSPIHLKSSTFRDFLKKQLKTFHFSQSILRFEISESSYIKHIDVLKEIIDLFQKDGTLFSLGNFGALDSSLSHLDQMSFETIKIDQLLTQKLYADKDSLMRAVIALGKTFGKEVLVEGIHNREQANKFWEMGADLCQGSHFGKPMSSEEMKQTLIS